MPTANYYAVNDPANRRFGVPRRAGGTGGGIATPGVGYIPPEQQYAPMQVQQGPMVAHEGGNDRTGEYGFLAQQSMMGQNASVQAMNGRDLQRQQGLARRAGDPSGYTPAQQARLMNNGPQGAAMYNIMFGSRDQARTNVADYNDRQNMGAVGQYGIDKANAGAVNFGVERGRKLLPGQVQGQDLQNKGLGQAIDQQGQYFPGTLETQRMQNQRMGMENQFYPQQQQAALEGQFLNNRGQYMAQNQGQEVHQQQLPMQRFAPVAPILGQAMQPGTSQVESTDEFGNKTRTTSTVPSQYTPQIMGGLGFRAPPPPPAAPTAPPQQPYGMNLNTMDQATAKRILDESGGDPAKMRMLTQAWSSQSGGGAQGQQPQAAGQFKQGDRQTKNGITYERDAQGNWHPVQ